MLRDKLREENKKLKLENDGLSLGSGRRWTPPHPTPGLELNLDLGGIATSPKLGPGPATSPGGPSLPCPYLAQAMGNKTDVPSGSPK
jgi:hypothetical protein